MILSNELPSGTRLRQVEVSERFGVSTTPVREAFAALARDGLVRRDAQRGVTVMMPSQDDLLENYEIRIALEPLATEKAAPLISEHELDELDRLIDVMVSSSPEQGQLRADSNRAFHRRIYASAGKPRLAEVIENLRDAGEIFLKLVTMDPPPSYSAQGNLEHRQIVNALRARDGETAAAIMRLHLEHNLERIGEVLRELRGEGSSPPGAAV
jgi:DNA-binding GntR family transcriptional regulator